MQGDLRALDPVPSLRGALWGTLSFRFAVAAIVIVVAGCGGGAAGGEADPATTVPADALVYIEALVRPEGSQREDALEAAGKVLLTDDPEAEIRAGLEERLDDLDYERDVEPWLGERAGYWMGPADDAGVVVLEATDGEEARSSLDAALKRNGGRVATRSHRDGEYLVDDDGVAVGVVGEFAIIGPEAAFKRTVDAAEGDSLADTERYTDAVDGLEDERLAHLWVDIPGLLEHARESDPVVRERLGLLPLEDMRPLTVSFTADGERLAAETKLRANDFGPLLADGSTPLLQELPGDAWAAAGAADAGEALRDAIDGFAGALGGLAMRREVRRRTGLNLDRDLLDWIGHVGFFVRGTTPRTLEGGLVIQPTDEDRAADAFGRLAGAIQMAARVRAQPVDVAGADQAFQIALPRSEHPLVLARGSGLVVAASSRAAAEAALGSRDRLGDSDLYAQAEELVGMEPGLLVSMPDLLELAAGGKPDPQFERARPHLEQLTVLAAGMTAADDEATARVAAGLK